MKIKKAKGSIRVVTYNAHFGADTAGISRAFKNNANLCSADVIFFQEIEHHPKEGISRAEKIAKELGLHFYYAPARTVKKNGTHGIATLSRYPLTENKVIELPYFKLILNPRQRICLVSKMSVAGNDITLCNIHLDARLNASQRIKQLDFAVNILAQNISEKIILGGDFNTHPLFLAGNMIPLFFQNQYRKLHNFLGLQGFVHFSRSYSQTMKRWFFGMYLDHIYTNTLPIINSGVEKEIYASDHFPVWADISLSNFH